MTRLQAVLLGGLSVTLTSEVGGAVKLEDIRTEWRAARYEATYRDCEVYRKQEYGKRADVYYMAATSLCRLPGRVDLGAKYMQWILANYPLSQADRAVVSAELDVCRTAQNPPAPATVTIVARATASSQGSAKMFFGIDGRNALFSVPTEVIREIAPDVFKARLFAPASSAAASRAATTRLSKIGGSPAPRPSVSSSRRFVVASYDARPAAQLGTVGRQLDTAFEFFVTEYGMRAPASLITVYLVNDATVMRRVADNLYGLRLSAQSIGFSFQDDLSMLGIVQSTATGTLQHELFHLMVRNNFGDAPPWLDEGMAALYEQSVVRDGRLAGEPNWRGEVLRRFGQDQPTVERLVAMNWFEFSGGTSDFDTVRQSAIHAKARYFTLYLQQKSLLTSVYKAFQTRDIGTDPAATLSATLGRDLKDVERDFQTWFAALPH
jgi:hypothetical protein